MVEKYAKSKKMGGHPRASVESRVKARAKLLGLGQPPSIVVRFVGKDGFGTDAVRATIGEKELTRVDGETFEAFEARVRKLLPVNRPGVAIIWSTTSQSIYIASATLPDGTKEAFESLPSETSTDFSARMKAEWGETGFSLSGWTAGEFCPYEELAVLVEQTKQRHSNL